MKSKFNYLIISLLLIFFISSCEKTDEIKPGDKNSVFIEFDNRLGAEEIVLGTTKGTNSTSEDFTITRLNYFISNIKLMSATGETVSFPDQYSLVKESDTNSQVIELKDVPAGDYNHLMYTIGVDSIHSVSDVSLRTGVLDPAGYGDDNMYWSWNMGYIFFKMEGNSSKVNVNGSTKYELHIGGFGGKDAPTPNNIRNLELHMNQTATVRRDIAPDVHVIFDVAKVFDGTKKVSLVANPVIHNPKLGIDISENYAEAFMIDHVHLD